LGAARNVGVGGATGKYIGFIDSDDWCHLQMFEKLYKMIESSDADFVMCAMVIYDSKRKIYNAHSSYHSLKRFPTDGGEVSKKILEEMFSCSAFNKLFNAQFLHENKIKFAEGVVYEDVYFYADVCTHLKRCFFTKEQLYIYRQNRADSLSAFTNISFKRQHDRITYTKYLYEKFKRGEIFKDNEDSFWGFVYSTTFVNFFKEFLAPSTESKEQKAEIYQEMQDFFNENLMPQAVLERSLFLQEQARLYTTYKTYEEREKYEKQNKKSLLFRKSIKKEFIRHYFLGIGFFKKDISGKCYFLGIRVR